MRLTVYSFLCLTFCLCAAQKSSLSKVPVEEIQEELDVAEAQYDRALQLFNPWYTGPLITPSASMVPPGEAMWQPYLYFTDTYGAFNEDRKRVSAPNLFSISPQPVFVQIGATPSVDTTIFMGTVANWQEGHFGGGIQDMLLKVGFLVQSQQVHVPGVKFTIGQSFPTGKYQNLTHAGVDATGAGAWQTTFSLALAKLILWDTLHPINTRLALGYTVPTSVAVQHLNAYGGGRGTRGTVHPGNSFEADLGLEVSINQPWVAALDIVYKAANRTTFSGSTSAPVGSGSSDQLSLAPAIEYNFNGSMGMVGGIWFSVYGRNTSNFVSAIYSWYWEF